LPSIAPALAGALPFKLPPKVLPRRRVGAVRAAEVLALAGSPRYPAAAIRRGRSARRSPPEHDLIPLQLKDHPMKLLLSAALAALTALPAVAEIRVLDPYIRVAGPMARSGAAYLVIENTGPEADRLTAVSSDAAMLVSIHTHRMDAQGMMQMLELTEGIVLPPGGSHGLKRGGDHLMFMGLSRPLVEGAKVTIRLTFEKAGEIVIEAPVDNVRTE